MTQSAGVSSTKQLPLIKILQDNKAAGGGDDHPKVPNISVCPLLFRDVGSCKGVSGVGRQGGFPPGDNGQSL